MPTFSNNPLANWWKRLLQINQSANTGADATTRTIQSGDGVDTALSLSDDVLSVQPVNDDTTGAMLVKNKGGSNILAVDTDNSKVLAGASQVNALTLYKEMGLYEFSPYTAGGHYPLIANRIGVEGAEDFSYEDDWGSATDPPTTLDLSGLTDPENAVAVYWYLENNIYIDSVRFMVHSDANVTLNFHLFTYTLDTSTNFGDLSAGTVTANGTVSSIANGLKTGTMSIDDASNDAGEVIIGFVENVTSATDMTVHFNIRYHVR